jgi:hypothetical protein
MKPRDGRDGRDADPQVIRSEIERVLSEHKADKGAQGPKGDQGPKGEKGDKGDKGDRGEAGKDGSARSYRFTVLRDEFDRITEVVADPI